MSHPAHVAAALAAADASLAASDPFGALTHLGAVLAHPEQPEDAALFVAALGTLARAVGGVFPDLVPLLERVAERPDDVDALYHAGFGLVENDLPGFAATLLGRAAAIAPAELRVLTERVTALELLGAYRDAATAAATRHPALADSFLARYLHAFEAGLAGDLAPARAARDWLEAHAADEAERFMAQRISGWTDRADALCGAMESPPEGDLARWHALLFGGVVLAVAPEGAPGSAGAGRFGLREDRAEDVRRAVDAVGAVLAGLERAPERVYRLDERRSRILAAVAGASWGVPVAVWSAEARAPGVVVAWDLRKLPSEERDALRQSVPGEVLWDHACAWTVEARLTADLTSAVSQGTLPAWDPDEEVPEAEVVRALLAVAAPEPDAEGVRRATALARALGPSGGPLRAHGERPKRWPWGMR